MDDITQSPLYGLANPKSVVFFGASNSFAAMGTNILQSLLSLGFEGPVYPVHPKEETVRGLTAYKSVLDVPDTPELAVMVLPTRLVLETMEQCGQKGVKFAVVITAGFAEVGGDGEERQQELVAIAKKYGIRFVGPNCLGVANPHHKLNTTFLPCEGRPGPIGLASQSGSFVTQIFNFLARLETGFSTAFSMGNGADVDLVDCLEYLEACPHTRVIALYVEGIRRGRDFVRVATRVAKKKPIVALYIGGSETGRRAGLSHTGSLAGPDSLYEGMFRQCGIVRANSVTEMFDLCRALGQLPEPAGNRVAIQTHSGGPGAAGADACGRLGLELPPLSEPTQEKLAEFVPHTGSMGNPVDITYSKNPMDFFEGIPRALLEEPDADMLLVYYLMPPEMVVKPLMAMGLDKAEAEKEAEKWLQAQAQATANLLKEYGKPIVGCTFRGLEEQWPRFVMARGVPVYADPERAARVLSAMVWYSQWKNNREGQA